MIVDCSVLWLGLQVLKEDGQITVNIVGTSGVAAVWGFHHYLKYYCFCHVSWDSDQLALPEDLPTVNITVVSADRLVIVTVCSVLQSNFYIYVVTVLTNEIGRAHV
jgi:alpha-N-acetylglucosaminidase